MKKLVFLSIILFLAASAFSQKSIQKKLKNLDKYYEQALKDWEVPGMAIAIVKDDSVIFEKGYGVLDVNENQTVDEYSMFPIASNSKAFTATALGILVEKGQLNWNDKVRDHLPWFQMYDPYVTCNMTVRDLLCHRSGLATFSGDLLWYASEYDRKQVVQRAQYLEPVYGFRAHYGYSNIMYIAAGLIIEKITGQSWDEYIAEQFFLPLQMKRSVTSINTLTDMKNVASPHTDYVDDVIAIPYQNWDNVAPAGGIISCSHDVAQWLRLQLNRGIYKSDTLFSNRISHQMWSPQTIQGVSAYAIKNGPTQFKSYGLGWALKDYHGKKVVSHGGGYDGMISQTAMIPEEGLGIVVLTNKNSWLILPILNKTMDVFLDAEEKDWSEYYLKYWDNAQKAKKEAPIKFEEERIKNTKPSLELEAYTGTYQDEMYGDAEVKLIDDQLHVQLLPAPSFHAKMKHYHFDTFEIEFTEYPSLPKGLLNFTLDEKGKVNTLKIDVPNPDFDFTELEFVR
jgi:CubicO group peptidase (beta-lactamase class C family)